MYAYVYGVDVVASMRMTIVPAQAASTAAILDPTHRGGSRVTARTLHRKSE
jgi:hypothetical protein